MEASINGDCNFAATLQTGTNEYLFIIAFCISLLYSIPSLYITYRIAEATTKKPIRLASPFFRLFLHDRLLAFIFFSYGMIFIRLPLTGTVTMLLCKIPANFLITSIYVVYYYLNYAVIYSTLAISLLRATAVLRPFDSIKLQERLAWMLAAFVYVIPVVTTWFLVPAMAFYTPVVHGASVTIDYKKVFPEWRSSLALVFVTSLTCGLDLMCFIVTIIGWRTLLSKRRPSSSKGSEKSLLFLTCSVCVSLMLNCVLQFFFYFDILTELSFLVRGFVDDMLVFVPTWVFYFTHPAFRGTNVIKLRTPTIYPSY